MSYLNSLVNIIPLIGRWDGQTQWYQWHSHRRLELSEGSIGMETAALGFTQPSKILEKNACL